jgi:hypothetical protein
VNLQAHQATIPFHGHEADLLHVVELLALQMDATFLSTLGIIQSINAEPVNLENEPSKRN